MNQQVTHTQKESVRSRSHCSIPKNYHNAANKTEHTRIIWHMCRELKLLQITEIENFTYKRLFHMRRDALVSFKDLENKRILLWGGSRDHEWEILGRCDKRLLLFFGQISNSDKII